MRIGEIVICVLILAAISIFAAVACADDRELIQAFTLEDNMVFRLFKRFDPFPHGSEMRNIDGLTWYEKRSLEWFMTFYAVEIEYFPFPNIHWSPER